MKTKMKTMIITIEGDRASGKTTLAKKICAGRKYSCIDESMIKTDFWAAHIDESVEFLIFDEVSKLDEIYNFFKEKNGVLTINIPCKKPSKIRMPHIILIKQTEK